MIKGNVGVSNQIRYRIYSSPREREGMGAVVSSTRLDDFDSTVVVYESGMVVIESPRRYVEFNLKDGGTTLL